MMTYVDSVNMEPEQKKLTVVTVFNVGVGNEAGRFVRMYFDTLLDYKEGDKILIADGETNVGYKIITRTADM